MFTPADIAKLAAAVAATIALTLLWVHRSAQQRVDRSVGHSIKVALRLLAIHAVAVYGLCIVEHMPVNIYLAATAVVYLIAAAISWETAEWFPWGDNVVSFAICAMLVGPPYFLKQFVLGFPDLDRVILSPPPAPPRTEPPPPQAETGTVVATLRPMGKVELAGGRFDAMSAYGKLIDVGTPVRVTGRRGDILLVAEIPTEARVLAATPGSDTPTAR